jgi:hypothetical protein
MAFTSTNRLGADIMNVIEAIAQISIPRWMRISVVAMIALLTAAYAFVVYYALIDQAGRDRWVEAGAYILGLLLPVLLVGATLLFAEVGADFIHRRTCEFLAVTVPAAVAMLDFHKIAYASRPRRASRPRGARASIRTGLARGGSVGFYEVTAPLKAGDPKGEKVEWRRLSASIELNVRKANVIVLLPPGEGAPKHQISDLRQRFQHTLEGAELEGYKVHNALFPVDHNLQTIDGLVLTRRLPDKFLSNPSERVYFAQDVMLMLRSFLREAPEIFPLASTEKVLDR